VRCFNYADEYAGNAITFDTEGRYNCGRCNMIEGEQCLLLAVRRVNLEAGSCEDWEVQSDGDRELALFRKPAAVSSYGIARSGEGFGCSRCPYSVEAKNADDRGRTRWCGWGAFHQTDAGCCAANGAELTDEDPGETDPAELPALAADSVTMAFDRDTVRSFDQDGRMRIAVTNISKANICPYKGSEIPNSEELGLEPDKIYRLLRAPDELEKSVPTWNGIQLLKVHKPVDVKEPEIREIVGTTGTNAEFVTPYLRNSLVLWTQEGIDLVESQKQRELSCGYHYDPDMTPGVYDGEPYDGVMRNIRGNHVAIVEEGRAGPDVVVADSITEMQWAAIEEALEL
jgi:hypothetical protein